MKYDIFISYSRKDLDVANKLCEALDSAKISYWIDRNIHGSSNFLSEITRYIRECKVVVFIASSNSAESKWTQREILFAEKHNKPIVPYRIGDFSFENNDELDFVFMNVQWIESVADVVTSLEKLGCTVAEKAEVKENTPISVAKTYKVGDYYDDGVKQGVVFDVWDAGRHGKIVSLNECLTRWCSIAQYHMDKDSIWEGAEMSHLDGKLNTNRVMSWANSSEYLAFVWCRQMGVDWYLPAIDELKLLLLNYDVRNLVDSTLEYQKATKLFNKIVYKSYWSSTEKDQFCAWYIRTLYDVNFTNKPSECYVRAVATF